MTIPVEYSTQIWTCEINGHGEKKGQLQKNSQGTDNKHPEAKLVEEYIIPRSCHKIQTNLSVFSKTGAHATEYMMKVPGR
jgi:hypothetical protein